MPTWCGCSVIIFREQCSTSPVLFAGKYEEQAGPDISRLALHLQQEWDHAPNAHLGSIIIAPQSDRKAWWSNGMCKTGQPHRWLTRVSDRSRGIRCPYDSGRAVCPCNNLAHKYAEVAAEWDWEAAGERTSETVTASNNIKATWSCCVCGHRWSATMVNKTRGTGSPQCTREASCKRTWQPSISAGAPHLLAEWDWILSWMRSWVASFKLLHTCG